MSLPNIIDFEAECERAKAEAEFALACAKLKNLYNLVERESDLHSDTYNEDEKMIRIMFDVCMDYMELYWTTYKQQPAHIKMRLPKKDRFVLEGYISRRLAPDIMIIGRDDQKKKLIPWMAEYDLWWYDGEFTNDIPEDFDLHNYIRLNTAY